MHKQMRKLLALSSLCLSTGMLLGCPEGMVKNNDGSGGIQDRSVSSSQSNGSDPLGCIEKDRLNPKGLKEAWKIFTADGRYRIAGANDFQLPELAITKRIEDQLIQIRKNGPVDVNRERILQNGIREQYLEKTKCPLMGAGDFNHDGNWYDLAVIVVDTKNNSGERFGLVIFNRQKDDDDPYLPFWLYRNKDLSKTVLLNAIKDNLMISELRDDGSIIECWVRWDSTLKTYSCHD